MSPDDVKIKELVKVLKEKKIGVVAHFYMDPEVQGVLTAAQKQWPHIRISDSLVMADTAVRMAEAGCEYITVLGVDFMSENVRAILDQAGYEKVFLDLYSLILLQSFVTREYSTCIASLHSYCGLASIILQPCEL